MACDRCGQSTDQDGEWPFGTWLVCLECWEDHTATEWWYMVAGLRPEAKNPCPLEITTT